MQWLSAEVFLVNLAALFQPRKGKHAVTWAEHQFTQIKSNQEDYSEVCVVKGAFLCFNNLLAKIYLNLFIRGKHQEKVKPTSKNDENRIETEVISHSSCPYGEMTGNPQANH